MECSFLPVLTWNLVLKVLCLQWSWRLRPGGRQYELVVVATVNWRWIRSHVPLGGNLYVLSRTESGVILSEVIFLNDIIFKELMSGSFTNPHLNDVSLISEFLSFSQINWITQGRFFPLEQLLYMYYSRHPLTWMYPCTKCGAACRMYKTHRSVGMVAVKRRQRKASDFFFLAEGCSPLKTQRWEGWLMSSLCLTSPPSDSL